MQDNELKHYGTKGMHWGIRLYQNKDGSLTELGKKRAAKMERSYDSLQRKKKIHDGNLSEKQVKKEKSILEDYDILTDGRDIKNVATRQSVKKDLRSYSNEELKAITERINMEKTLTAAINDLNKLNNPPKEQKAPKEKSSLKKGIETGVEKGVAAGVAGGITKSINNLFPDSNNKQKNDKNKSDSKKEEKSENKTNSEQVNKTAKSAKEKNDISVNKTSNYDFTNASYVTINKGKTAMKNISYDVPISDVYDYVYTYDKKKK